MQSAKPDGEILETNVGDKEELAKKVLELDKKHPDLTHKIGMLPNKGDQFNFDNLLYKVIFVDKARGIFHAKKQ